MGNSSIVVYTDMITTNQAIKVLESLTDKKVISNSLEFFDDVYNKFGQMITILGIDKKEYSKLKNRKAFKDLRKNGSLKNW